MVRKVAEIWPAEVEAWRRCQGNDGPAPRHEPDCRRLAGEGRVRILSPRAGAEYFLRGVGDEERLFLSALPPAGAAKLHWFVDGERVASVPPAEAISWPLRRGAHQVRCVDDRGASGAVEIVVR